MAKITLIKYLVLTLILIGITRPSAADEQQDRIKKMGFISIKDASSKESKLDTTKESANDEAEVKEKPEPKRVPEAKVINIPQSKSNQKAKKDSKKAVAKQAPVQTENKQRKEDYFELYEPIFVYADGTVSTAQDDSGRDWAEDSAEPINVYGERTDSNTGQNSGSMKKKGLVQDNYDYYNEILLANSFQGIDRNPNTVVTTYSKLYNMLEWCEKQGIRLFKMSTLQNLN